MLEKVSAIINERLKIQEGSDEFKQLISESFSDDNVEFIKDRSKIKMFDIFGEETKVDLVTDNTLTKSDAFDDNYHVQLNPDITDDDLTPLQNIDAFDDKYEAKYDHDLTTDNLLDKEVAYSDNQRTPVDITGYSAESSRLFNENYYAEEEENVEADLKKGATEEGSSKLDDTPAMFFENNELGDNANSKIELECGDNGIISDKDSNEFPMFFEDDELTDIDNDSIDAGGDDMSTIEQPERADADQTTMGEPTVTQMMFEAADDECEECEEEDEDKKEKKKEKDNDEEEDKEKDDEEDKKDTDADDDEPEKAIEKLDDEEDDKENKKDEEDEEEEKKSSFFFD